MLISETPMTDTSNATNIDKNYINPVPITLVILSIVAFVFIGINIYIKKHKSLAI